jgi:hypothetical protein
MIDWLHTESLYQLSCVRINELSHTVRSTYKNIHAIGLQSIAVLNSTNLDKESTNNNKNMEKFRNLSIIYQGFLLHTYNQLQSVSLPNLGVGPS